MKKLFAVVLATLIGFAATIDVFAKGGKGGKSHAGKSHSGKSSGSSKSYSAPSSRDHSVRGSVHRNGTYVPPHRATNPNATKRDNYSSKGNVNPYTGKEGTKDSDR